MHTCRWKIDKDGYDKATIVFNGAPIIRLRLAYNQMKGHFGEVFGIIWVKA